MAALSRIVSHTLGSHWSRPAQLTQHWAPIGRGGQANDPRYEWRRHNGNVASHSPTLDCRTHSMGRYTDIQPWRQPGYGGQQYSISIHNSIFHLHRSRLIKRTRQSALCLFPETCDHCIRESAATAAMMNVDRTLPPDHELQQDETITYIGS